MKKAFTLAEVLITLAIIGVVAALTIPAAVHKYQQIVLYTQFKEAVSTLNQAFQLAVDEYGSAKNWHEKKSYPIREGYQVCYSKLIKYMSIAKSCSQGDKSCFASKYRTINGRDANSYIDYELPNQYSAILSNGMSFFINLDHTKLCRILIDTNGLKGPNIVGRDLFYFDINLADGILEPYSCKSWDCFSVDGRTVCNPCDNLENLCKKNSSEYCGQYLIHSKKMDY